MTKSLKDVTLKLTVLSVFTTNSVSVAALPFVYMLSPLPWICTIVFGVNPSTRGTVTVISLPLSIDAS